MILIWFHWFKLELDQVLIVLLNRSNKVKSHINFYNSFKEIGEGFLNISI